VSGRELFLVGLSHRSAPLDVRERVALSGDALREALQELARGEGVGERVTPLPFEDRDFLLLLPPFGVDTGAVYRAWDADPSDARPNGLEVAAQRVEPRLTAWRDALGELTGRRPALAGSGSTWFVEGGPPEAGTASLPEMRRGGQVARLVRARTVPAGWQGD